MSRTPDLSFLPVERREGEGPVFQEPWEAKAFAMALSLHAQGLFTWPEWTEALGAELARAGEDEGSGYYRHWLRALERLIVDKGAASNEALGVLKAAWLAAAARTSHGTPIELAPEDWPAGATHEGRER